MDKLVQLNNWKNGVNKIKATLKKDDDPIRFGVLGAANINYAAIFDPIQTHPGAICVAVAARDKARAQSQVDKYSLGSDCKALGSYEELLADKNVDAVYIPLPNGLHFEWAVKALQAGKDVLLEKPSVSNEDEARQLKEAAAKYDRVVLEAYHWRFHPAAHRVKSLIDSGKYGNVLSLHSTMVSPGGFVKKGDIRLNYSLAGGACMDLCYIFSTCTYFACATSEFPQSKVTFSEAKARVSTDDKRIDEAMECAFTIEQEGKPPIRCRANCALTQPPLFGVIPKVWHMPMNVRIELEKATIVYDGFLVPTFSHSIDIIDKQTGSKETEKVYAGGEHWGTIGQQWWTTYRWQLEAFVDQLKAKKAGKKYEGPWMTLDESEKLMEVIDGAYDKAGLPRRGT